MYVYDALKLGLRRGLPRISPNFVPNTRKLYILRQYINSVLILQKNNINPSMFIF